jgi:hypothetical protein
VPHAIRSAPRRTRPAAPSIHSHSVTDSVLHSDQRKQKAVKVTPARRPSRQLQPETPCFGFLTAFDSLTAPRTTRAPRMPQKSVSCAVNGKPPRSQNH